MSSRHGKSGMSRRDFVKTMGWGLGALQTAGMGVGILQLTGCGGGSPGPQPVPAPQIVSWPISREVYTTAVRQVCPLAVPATSPQIKPGEVVDYATYDYSAWRFGGPLQHVVRKDIAPAYTTAPNVARLLFYYSMSDIHIADKESPAQPIYVGLSCGWGSGMSSAYSPILLSTPQVLDAAVQTINVLHRVTPFDFGISLGDDCNNTQYNEVRWFIDTLDGKVITPSSGAHAGASTIDYQRPFYAAGLNPAIPWYQVIGNHDQFWMGSSFENTKTRSAHIGSDILNIAVNCGKPGIDSSGAYMGVVDGSTIYGNIIDDGPTATSPRRPPWLRMPTAAA